MAAQKIWIKGCLSITEAKCDTPKAEGRGIYIILKSLRTGVMHLSESNFLKPLKVTII